MPTIPQEPHQARRWAESFGVDAERYDRTRPRYPEALIQRITGKVVDVGCGTGIVARQLQVAGCQVVGVEVDERMADYARDSGVAVEVAAFEEWDPSGRTFDAVVSGQSWHWIDPVAGAARAANALRPSGLLAVFWNVHQLPHDLGEAFAAVYREVAPDAPGFASGLDAHAPLHAKAADGIRAAAAFTAPEQWRFDWQRSYTRAQWLDQVPTFGGHSRLPAAQLDGLLAGLGAAIDAVGGRFTMRYATVAVAATRA
jgi:SAM-dependent methyltransferase